MNFLARLFSEAGYRQFRLTKLAIFEGVDGTAVPSAR